MVNYGFVIDQRKCIGCHACTVACKSEHDVPVGVNRTHVKYIESGTYPNTSREFSVHRCNHCEDSPCTKICPTSALYPREDGIVDFDDDRCIGCKSCMQACPYDALYINPNTGTAAKCNYCAHRIEASYEPACVVVCPVEAIVSGDLDDENSTISGYLRDHEVKVRKPESGAKPNLFYVQASDAMLDPAATDRHLPLDRPSRWRRALREVRGPAPRRGRHPLDDRPTGAGAESEGGKSPRPRHHP
jgi:Fe-S-cluster-containing dehydrogenase component